MKILIAGSHGMIGAAVTSYLIERGHEVTRLAHGKPQDGELHWDPDAGMLDAAALEGFDAVINLATMPWPFRWTARSKKAMQANKLATNGLLARALAACSRKPRVLICASGVGTYPSSGDDVLTEDCPQGSGFIARLDQIGEAATAPAEAAGIRVVHLRLPMVLGGVRLQQIGFQTGDGQQWTSWIALQEVAAVVEFALRTESLSGPVNAVSPNAMRNGEFARACSAALGQKPGGTMPVLIVRLVMGEFGEEMFLASRRVAPGRLLESGYRFQYADLAEALRHEQAVVEAQKARTQAAPAHPKGG